MNRNEILEKLKECIISAEPNVDLSKVTEESRINEDLGLLSIEMIYILFSIEEKFNIKLKNENLTNVVLVKDMVDIIESKL